MPTMEPDRPPTPTPASDSYPSIPVSHPRTSPRSPASTSPSQPPISPPRPSVATPTATQTTFSSSLVAAVSETADPPMSCTTLPNSTPMTQLDPDTPSVPAMTSADPSEPRVPNVYINGLPPNFPEEQLYALTKDFGGVVSVRTFTRHVSDRPSGYGFVLFDSIESAEKCIEALRRYRNLHPSFCKNFHPIPGTRYASLPTTGAPLSPSPSSPGTDIDSFKSRMERLKDESSTNLYIEGLPLSIDEPTMAALVAPYTIKSSRFFQTRLSHPPRTIAFVRLETRSACADIIKRLHGRMVRGWNDPGSRISVRFADSAEQRELRRSERSTGRADDSSPARLTMAQAALLNLRGQKVQGQLRAQQQLATVSDQRCIQTAQSQPNLHDLSGMYHQHSRLPPHPVITQSQSEPENLATSHSVPSRPQGRINTETSVGLSAALGSDIDLSALSCAAGANGFTPLEQQLILQARLQAELDARRRPFYNSQGSTQVPIDQTEDLSRSINNLGLRSALPAKEFVPRTTAPRVTQPQTYNPALSSRMSVDLLTSEVIENYHASKSYQSHPVPLPCQQQQHGGVNAINSRVLGLMSKDGGLKNHSNASLIGDQDCTALPFNSAEFVPDGSEDRGPIQREEQQNLAVHMRSTTLPPHFTVGSSSIAHNTGTVSLRLNGILSPTLHSGAGVVGKLNAGVSSSEIPISREIDPLPSDVKLMHLHNPLADSPFLIPSPALTYNSSSSVSSRTPSTLSPSTPFFGSFPHPGDGFGTYNGEEHGDKTDAVMTRDVTAFDISTQIHSGSG